MGERLFKQILCTTSVRQSVPLCTVIASVYFSIVTLNMDDIITFPILLSSFYFLFPMSCFLFFFMFSRKSCTITLSAPPMLPDLLFLVVNNTHLQTPYLPYFFCLYRFVAISSVLYSTVSLHFAMLLLLLFQVPRYTFFV